MIPTPQPQSTNRLSYRAQLGGSRFYWIAGLSLVSAILRVMQTHFGFAAAFAIPTILAALTNSQVISPAYLGSLGILLVIFMGCGYFASLGAKWAFIAGGLIYIVDGIGCYLIKDYMSLAIHAYFLYRMMPGFIASIEFEKGR